MCGVDSANSRPATRQEPLAPEQDAALATASATQARCRLFSWLWRRARNPRAETCRVPPGWCLQATACTYRIALGPRAGQQVLSLRTVAGREEKNTTALCAEAHGFSLHAAVRCGAHQRKELERLCRTITRPALANERVKRDGAGNVVLQLKSAWRDGTTHLKLSPLEFMQRLAALVPRPRLHLIRFHGVLAPNAGLRAAIVPGPPEKTGDDAAHDAHEAPARMSWARLLRRVFGIDLEHCPQCGGELKIIAAIEEPAVIVRFLTHLGLPARAPPRPPARPLDLFQAA